MQKRGSLFLAFNNAKALFLLTCATLLVGASAYAKTKASNASVRIGIFNTQKSTQSFYESLPDHIQRNIEHGQLWLNAYESQSGFIEHQLEVTELAPKTAKEICQTVKKRNVQCLLSTKTKWVPAPLGLYRQSQSPSHASNELVNDSERAYIPILKPLGIKLDNKTELSDFDLALKPSENNQDFKHQTSLQAYSNGFTPEPMLGDSIKTQAAKAAYASARNRFIDTLRRVGNRANAGDGVDAAREELMTLGRALFETAGSTYLSGFLEREVGQAETLSSDANAGKTFIYHVQKNVKKSAEESVKGLINELLSGANNADDLDNNLLKNTTDKFMISGAQGLINAGLASAKRSDLYALRNLEIEYTLNDFEDSYFTILTTQPIYQSTDLRHNIFLQGGGIINEDSVDIDDDENRHTLNLGAAYRYLTVDEKYLLGANVFYDHQWPYNHSRMSLGVDAKTRDLNFAANYYYPLTNYRDSRTDNAGNQFEERALEGYDVELGYTLPFLSDMTIFGKGYQYFRETDDDIRGLELSGEYNIRDNFTLRGSLIEENGGRDGVELALQYRVPLYNPEKPNLALAAIESAAGNESVRSKIFDKVRRENTIRVEERLKVDDDAEIIITAQFNALSIGLPFDVGGAATGAGVNLPFNTAITVPNGDFGIINFSNGAIANVSASGGGDVILEFNNETLTVTATNGGFVQFISGSGGISTVNVPGGTVNLLGTDIDVTDDGTTTTIQVRAGQIETVPDVGVAVLNGNQGNVVSLTIASGATALLVDPALETRQEAAFTNLDLINPDPPIGNDAAPFINALPALITGPQFVGNNADIQLTFTQAVTVAGAPFLNGLVDANARTFAYDAGASTPTQLVFRHVFIAGDVGAAGITINDLDLNGGTIIGTGNGLNAITAFTDITVPINDATPPSLTSSTPADNEPAFSAVDDIVLNFNENIQAGIGNIFITDTTDGSDNRIIPIGDAQISIVGSTLTLNPTTNLELGSDYDITIASGVIEDTSGNDFAGITTGNLNFTTSTDTTPPLFTGANIADNAVQIARNSNIVLNFDENVVFAGTITLTDTDDASSSVSYTSASPEVTVGGSTITINPSTDLEYAENYEITWPLGAVQDAFSNNTLALTSGDLNFRTVNLEETLTLTLGITAPDGNVDETNVQGSGITIPTSGTYVMALDLTIPASPDGLIWECGGAGQGQFVGFNATDSVFRIRGGEGGNAPPDTDMAFFDVPFGSFTAGDYTLTFEYDFAARRVRAWLDENLLGDATSAAALESNRWSGGDNCAFFTNAQGSLTVAEPATAFNGTLLSPTFRYYNTQTVP